MRREACSYFLSDVHLMADEPATADAFLTFIHTKAIHAEALYILGDLFEVWLGEDSLSLFEQQIIKSLKNLSDTGVAVYFMAGNRDFLWTPAFSQRLGITWLQDPTVVERYGQKILISHGDALCIHDRPYQRLRGVVRNPLFQGLFRRLPLTTRVRLAERARSGSQQHTQHQRMEYMDVDDASVIQWLQVSQCQTLIHGHTHRPGLNTLHKDATTYYRYTLGDWHPTGMVARWDRDGLALFSSPLA
jgi:UDP-2,3-diacylglucosamine hydrolase